MKKQTYGISVVLFLFDQLTKFLIIQFLPLGHSETIISPYFSFTFVKNTGGAFSILSGNVFLLSMIGIFLFLLAIYWIEKNPPQKFLESFSVGCVMGGLLGNLFDRIVRGGVIDFLDFHFFSYHFPIFNIADIAIVLGIGFLFILEWRGGQHESR